MRTISILVTFSLLLGACSKENLYDGDHFFVKSEGAQMPVIIKGNIESGVVVLFLHGGPGGNASTASFLPVFKELEDNYALAYWDQRASGLSQGNPSKESFTVEQFVNDLDLVVDAINARHDNPKIVLYGLSWGGALGAAYLSTGSLQDKITGFICMDSGHNLLEGLPKSVDWTEVFAQNKINAGDSVQFWTEVRDWCAADPDMTVPDNFFTYQDYLRETDAFRYDKDAEIENAQIGGAEVMNSYMSLSVFFNGRYLAQNFNILELNLSPQMGLITVPSSVFWGRHDGINTIEMGFDAFNSLGSANKEMVIFENSAHEAYVEEQNKFQSEFRRFINSII